MRFEETHFVMSNACKSFENFATSTSDRANESFQWN